MLKLPPHLTHLLQPLDVGVFKPLKALQYSAVADFVRREHRSLSKWDFPEVMSGIWRKYRPETGKGGFKGCGIYPFNGSVVSAQSTRYSESFVDTSSSGSSHPSAMPSVSSPSTSSTELPPSTISTELPPSSSSNLYLNYYI